MIIILISAAGTGRGEMLWPIDFPKKITGTFGEYRGYRYHLGMDVGTHGKTGYKIFAAEKGYVSAVMYQKWGIGYAVFVKHENGLTTFYGHMEKFAQVILNNEKIKKQGDNILDRLDFRVDFNMPEIVVAKGSVLGFSGETGLGPEHLHFEVRENDNIILNPLKNGIVVHDVIPPVIKKIHVVPLDSVAHVDGSSSPAAIPAFLKNKGAGLYGIKRASIPAIGGRIGLKVTAHDYIGSGSAVAPYRITLHVNGKQVWDFILDRIERSESHRMGLYYDYDLSTYSEYTFYLYSKIDDTGVITADNHDRPLDIKVTCFDAAGNRSSVEFILKNGKKLDTPSHVYEPNLIPGRELALTSKDGEFRILFGRDSPFYREMIDLDTDKDYQVFGSKLTIKSSAYILGPTNLCIDKPARISIKYDGDDFKKVGIYRKSKNSFNFIGNSYSKWKGVFTAQVSRMGTYFLVRDDTPPIIRFKNTMVKKTNQGLIINISDTGSGIDLSTVDLKVDDQKVKWDYEIDRYYLEILSHNNIWKKGRHKISVSLMDRAENRSSETFYYMVE